MNHRPDIDGLRAVAVVAVVLFHAGIPHFSGGFVGVDVFFVISGYLITRLLLDEIQTGCFSIANFYKRRALRLLPALFALLLITSVAAYKLLLPDVTAEYGKSLIATLSFSSNMLFAQHQGYFAAPDEVKPLLHTWSLAVEEQFYILYPLFLLLVARYFRKRYATAMGVSLCLSFAGSIWAVHAYPNVAFYAAPARAWELLVGAFLAIELIPAPKRRIATHGLGLLGLGFILYSVLAFSADTAFPGLNAVYPCVGAFLIMYAGQSGASVVTSILTTRPVIFVGLISYSLYLWHWPLIVFAKYLTIRPLTGWETTATVAVSIVAASFSWKFIETPFRMKGAVGNRAWILAGAVVCTLLFGAYGGLAVATRGFPGRFSNAVLTSVSGTYDVWSRREECLGSLCSVGVPNAELSFIVWGDSHAAAIAPMFDQVAQTSHLAGIVATRAACAPLLNMKRYDKFAGDCTGFNNEVLRRIKADHIRNVLLHARWGLYAEGLRYKYEPGEPQLLTPSRKWEDDCTEFDLLVHATLQELHRLDLNVVILASVPEVGMNVPSVLGRIGEFGTRLEVAPRYTEFMQRQARAFQILRRWAAEYSMKIVYPHEAFCDTSTCLVVKDGRDLYIDGDHLTVHGAMYLAPLFQQISMEWKSH